MVLPPLNKLLLLIILLFLVKPTNAQTIDAGLDRIVCNNESDYSSPKSSSVVVMATDPGAGYHGSWTYVSGSYVKLPAFPHSVGNPIITPLTSTSAQLDQIYPGSYTFRWTVYNAANVEISRDDIRVDIRVRAAKLKLSANSPPICQDLTTLNDTWVATAYYNAQDLDNDVRIARWEYSLTGNLSGSWTTIVKGVENEVGLFVFNDVPNGPPGSDVHTTKRKKTMYIRTVTVSNSPDCTDEVISDAVLYKIYSSVGGTASYTPQAACGPNSFSLALAGHTGSVLGWQSSNDGITWSGNITGSAGLTSYTTPVISSTTYFRAEVSDHGCTSANSTSVQVVVNPFPVPGEAYTDEVLPVCININSGIVKLKNYIGTSIQWESSTDNWVTKTILPGATTDNYTFTNVTGNTKFRAVVMNSCDSFTSTDVTVTTNPPVAANAGADQTAICIENAFFLAGNDPQGAIGEWTLTSGQTGISFSAVNQTNTQVYGLQGGQSYTFKWTIKSTGGCGDSVDDVTITTQAMAVGGTAIASAPKVCQGSTSTLTLTGYTGSIQWQSKLSSSSTWTNISGANSATYTTPALTVSTDFQAVLSSGVCVTATSNTVSVVVDPTPVGGTASASASEVCQGSTSTLTLTGYTGSIQWQSKLSSSSTWTNISGANLATYTTPGLTVSTDFQAVLSSGVCVTATSNIITVYWVSDPAAGSDQLNTCTTVILQGNNPAPGTGKWTVTSGQTGVFFDNDALPGATASNLQPGQTYTFRWTITLNSCVNSDDVQINTVPIASVSSPTINVCEGDILLLNGNTTNAGVWTVSPGLPAGISLSSSTNPNATVSNLQPGTYTFTWTVTPATGACSATSATTTVIVHSKAAVTSTTIDICQNSALTLNGNTLVGATGVWTFSPASSGASFSDITNPRATVSNLAPNSYTFTWMVSSSCGVTAKSTTVTVHSQASVSASSIDVCQDDTFNLNGNTLIGATGVWTVNTTLPSNVVFSNINDPQSTVSNLAPGGYLFTWNVTPTGSSCLVTSATATVTVHSKAAVTASSINICQNSTLTLPGVLLSGATGVWTVSPALPLGTNLSSSTNPQATINNMPPGNYTFTWTVTPTAGSLCSETFKQVTVNVSQLPQGGTAQISSGSATFCENGSGLITLTGMVGQVSKWQYATSAAGPWTDISSSSISSYTFSNITQSTWFRAMVANGSCTITTASSALAIIINRAPTVANAGTDQIVCVANTTLSANSPIVGTGLWSQVSGLPVTLNNPSNPIISINSLTAGQQYTFQWTITGSSSCPASTDRVIITVPSILTTSNAGLNDVLCNQSITNNTFMLKGNALQSNETGTWTIQSISTGGNVHLTTAESHKPLATVTNLLPGTYVLRWTISNGCAVPSSSDMTLRVIAKPSGGTLTSAITQVCHTQNTGTITLSGYTGSIFQWEKTTDPAGSTGWTTITTTNNTPYNNTTYTFGALTETTWYRCRVMSSDITVCDSYDYSQSLKITVIPILTANFGINPGTPIKIPNYTFTFTNTSLGSPVRYAWDFGDKTTSSEQNPSHTYATWGVYQIKLVVTNILGCTSEVYQTVEILHIPGYLYVPNAFEPSGVKDELKTFKPEGSGIASYSLKIFNKWGQIIWETKNLNENGSPSEGWDGTMNGLPAPQGIYIWMIKATLIDRTKWEGMKYEGRKERDVGEIYLIR